MDGIIVRRIDDLGRVVIPREVRRSLRIREGDPLELYIAKGEIRLKKHSFVAELSAFAQEYVDSLYEATGYLALISDRDNIVAVAGAPKKSFLNKRVGSLVERAMEDRKALSSSNPVCRIATDGLLAGTPLTAGHDFLIAPIVASGDSMGTVILYSTTPDAEMGDTERKLLQTAASFMGKQLGLAG